ncbi:glycosyltransferase [Pseudarthrobacter oxydans]|uniref:glycosyltransferase n=1 Tax=Pseudarthrobacter oxydans TaxID=1671 RepID=UPI002AA7B843|nr:glycosyltransferase [Pseudarthrobacter oxydans]WPU08583.1 glycosyltransferase [Pseudarthrobacter oxydans]
MSNRLSKLAIIGTRGYPSFYGGFETAVRKLAPYLVDTGWDVTVYGRDGAVQTEDPNRDSRVRTKTTPGLETKSLSTLTYGLTAVIDAVRDKPDAALIMNVANGFWIPLLKIRGIPTVVNVDGIEWERAKWGRLAKTVFKLGAWFTAKFATALVADSKEIQRRWKAEFGRDSHFIPYGGEMTGELPVPEGQKHRGYILIVARFVPENTVGEFFDAVETLAHEYPVVIVGSTGYGGELDARATYLAEHNNSVTWMGHVSDDQKLHALWQHAGAYFHGHSVGGTNPALVQAMACGAPIVARDTVYNREVLADTASFVVADPEGIANALRQVMERSAGGSFDPSGLKNRAQEFYSWRGVCKDYDAALQEQLGALTQASQDKVSRP